MFRLSTRVVQRLAQKNTGVFTLAARTMADDLASCKKTALFDAHVKANGKMVPFCGYALPVQYADALSASHNHVRTAAGLFDVSHMGQVKITGEHRVAFLETLCVTDIVGVKENLAKLSVLTNEKGGVYDDCMITKKADHIFMVLNAGCKDKDMAHIQAEMEKYNKTHPSADPLKLHYLEDRALVAIQGPKAATVVSRLVPNVDFLYVPFMATLDAKINGIDVAITRCGYTGEDGFEIGCANADATALWEILTAQPEVLPSGLGVRDSLRLEAGLCLYGHELDETTTPVEASLAWTISPRRKREGGFLGADVILQQLKDGPKRKLSGVEILGGAPARQGAQLLDKDGKEIGVVTSGGPAPSLNMKKIAIAYIQTPFAEPETEIQVNVRGKVSPAKVVKLPFVETHYHRVPKN